jgi:hypothetical protein
MDVVADDKFESSFLGFEDSDDDEEGRFVWRFVEFNFWMLFDGRRDLF